MKRDYYEQQPNEGEPSFVVEDRYEAYCPKCDIYLSWQQVTNNEKHCLCDTEVEWHPVGK